MWNHVSRFIWPKPDPVLHQAKAAIEQALYETTKRTEKEREMLHLLILEENEAAEHRRQAQ